MKSSELKTMRKTLGLTQSRMAHQLGISRATVARLEAMKTVPLWLELASKSLVSEKKGASK